jgi:hypothetical protein
MPPRPLRSALLATCAFALGCGLLVSYDDYRDAPPPGGATGGSASSAVSSGSASSSSSAGSGGSGGEACAPTTEVYEPSADSAISDGACNGANTRGGAEVLNCGIGPVLLDFSLSLDAAAALLEGRVISVELTLRRVLVHAVECAGACPAVAGSLVTYPLRSDWVEGNGTPYAGADWCRRTFGDPGDPWGAAGATAQGIDILGASGAADFDEQQASVSVTLDPRAHAEWLRERKLSVKVAPEAGTLVIGTKEYLQQLRSTLSVSFCAVD